MHRRKLWLLAGVVLAALALAATGSARVNGPASHDSSKAGTLVWGAEQGGGLVTRDRRFGMAQLVQVDHAR